MQQGEGGSLLLAVFCSDAEFRAVFFASCPVVALPYRFSIATQSSLPFPLHCVLGDCVSVWFRAATQSFGLFSLRRVLWGLCRTVSQSRRRVPCRFPCVVSCVVLCRTVSQSRRRVSCRFPCVVSWVIAFQCGSVPRRKVSGCFLCVVSCVGSAVPFLNRDA